MDVSLAGSAIGGFGFKYVTDADFNLFGIVFPRFLDPLVRVALGWCSFRMANGDSTFWLLEKPGIVYCGVTGCPVPLNIMVPGPYRIAYIRLPRFGR
jgi:hypothetical protein